MTGYIEDRDRPFVPLPLEQALPIDLVQVLLSEVPMRVALLDQDLRYRYVNRALLKQMGMTREQVLGHHFEEVRGAAMMKVLAEALDDLYQGKSLRWEGINHFPGQPTQYTESWLHPLRQPDGKVLILIYSHDLTELKAQQQLLQDQLDANRRVEHLKTVIVDNALAAFVSSDENGRVVEFNPAAEAMFGCSRAEALGRLVEDIMIPPEKRQAHRAGMQRMREGHAPRVLGKRMELTAQRIDGSHFPIEMVLWQTDVDGRPHYTASIIDVSERKQAAEIIERQRDALRHAERIGAMGNMLAGVAHELNNPLAIVMGRAALLEEKTTNTELAEDVHHIREAAERCSRIVRTFLDMARSRPSERRPINLNDLVQGAVDLLRYGLRSHGIQMQLLLAPNLPSPAANADQIGQIVLNLIVNAQQALADRPGHREIQVSTGLEATRDDRSPRVWLRVQDNGPGIPASERARVFEPYFTTKPTGQGLGLGLALCRTMAREHGGELQIEEHKDGPADEARALAGASFRLSLPLTADLSPTAEDAPLPAANTDQAARLLVVDDEPEIAELLRRFLESSGYDVAVADNGADALEMLAGARFDAIISDLRMPEVDGAGLWREVQQRWPHLARRLLFVTGDSLSAGASEFFAETDSPSLLKPFTKTELQAAVRQLLSRA